MLSSLENDHGKFVYASLARVDDGGPGDVASSRIAIIDRSAAAGPRKAVGDFFTPGTRGPRTLDQSCLRNKKSINFVYVRPGARSQTA
jgi:hypothetical protein